MVQGWNDGSEDYNVIRKLKERIAELEKRVIDEEFTTEPSEYKPRIPEFLELLEASKAIHIKKNVDYASVEDPFSNFTRSAEIVSWFKGVDCSFAALIGTKLARIAELRSKDGPPNNESIDDSFLDLVTYCALWGAYRKKFK